jgi:outer membrane protein insertion porin family
VGGAFHQFSTEFAGAIFGGTKFNKYTTDNRRYFRVGARTGLPKVFAMRLIGGVVTGAAPYLEQFLIGGPDSLRGYRVDRFAGSHMVVFNAEYRFPLSKNLVGVGFVDAGDAWGGTIGNDPFFESDKTFKLRVGYGVGVRVQTPVGPLRLDLGFSSEGAQTHFGVSQMF